MVSSVDIRDTLASLGKSNKIGEASHDDASHYIHEDEADVALDQ